MNHRIALAQQHQYRRRNSAAESDNIPPDISQSSFSDDERDDDEESEQMSSSSSCASEESSSVRSRKRVSSIRENWQRKSHFSKLSHETQQFQKIVADLELLLKHSGESPEAAWKARILVGSTQETDQVLQAKLQDYAESLLDEYKYQPIGLRKAQMAYNKLNRDFERSHNALVTALSMYELRQQAEISQLRAQRHEGPEEPDFFDRAVRQKELELISGKMNTVNNIYSDLAGLVEKQQDPIDRLEDETGYARANVEAAADEVNCYGQRRRVVGGDFIMCGAMEMPTSSYEPCGADNIVLGDTTTVDKTVSFSDDKPYGIRVTESFRWSMPFETFQEDLRSVRNDILDVGKGLVWKGKQSLQCGAQESAVL